MLEPCDGKLSCTVLRGEWGREAPDLPDRRSAPLNGREMLRHGELRGAQRRLTLHGGDGTDA